jgi:hypothetical protein
MVRSCAIPSEHAELMSLACKRAIINRGVSHLVFPRVLESEGLRQLLADSSMAGPGSRPERMRERLEQLQPCALGSLGLPPAAVTRTDATLTVTLSPRRPPSW